MYTEVSSFQGVGIDVYRGVLISVGWSRLYTEVSSFQRVGIDCIQRCPHFRGWEVSSFQRVGVKMF